MKLASITLLILAIICMVVRYVECYQLGFYEKSYAPLVYNIFLWIVEWGLFFTIISVWVISMFKKKYRLLATMTLLVLVVSKCFEHLNPPSNLIIYGMRNRVMRDYSLEILRHFARDFDQLPKLSKDLPGPTKGYMNEDLANSDLRIKYPFLSWLKGPGGFEGPSFVNEIEGVVDVRWGGELAGHWGFSVAVNGKKISPQESNVQVLRVSDDIFFIRER